MDVNDIRQMIRRTLKTKLLEASYQLSRPPRTFEEFRHQFALELAKAGANQLLVDEAYDIEYKSGSLFDSMWSTWLDLLPEIRSLRALRVSEAQSEWIFLRETYVRDAAISNFT